MISICLSVVNVRICFSGFICPVHTPDGSPCGILNHLTLNCELSTAVDCSSSLPGLLVEIGMSSLYDTGGGLLNNETCGPESANYLVMLNGVPIGSVHKDTAPRFTKHLRALKCQKQKVMTITTKLWYFQFKKKVCSKKFERLKIKTRYCFTVPYKEAEAYFPYF